MLKKITLCADDFGLNASVNQGILNLLTKSRIQATSCLTTLELWPSAGAELKNLRGQAECGLHFNLTENTGVTLGQLMRQAFLHQLKQQDLLSEMRRQIDAFAEVMGCLPDFIDGHQHVHQLPQIRNALLEVYGEYYPQKKAWIRVSAQPIFWQNFKSLKTLIIALSGGMALRKSLCKLNIPHNTTFTGIYNFNSDNDYAALFQGFLKDSAPRGLIMCHPALPVDVQDDADPIYKNRGFEYTFFNNTSW